MIVSSRSLSCAFFRMVPVAVVRSLRPGSGRPGPPPPPLRGNTIFLKGNLIFMDKELIEKAFEEFGITTEIRCEEAFAICEKYDIPKMDIARYCNRHDPKIKIRACQLGCFK